MKADHPWAYRVATYPVEWQGVELHIRTAVRDFRMVETTFVPWARRQGLIPKGARVAEVMLDFQETYTLFLLWAAAKRCGQITDVSWEAWQDPETGAVLLSPEPLDGPADDEDANPTPPAPTAA